MTTNKLVSGLLKRLDSIISEEHEVFRLTHPWLAYYQDNGVFNSEIKPEIIETDELAARQKQNELEKEVVLRAIGEAMGKAFPKKERIITQAKFSL